MLDAPSQPFQVTLTHQLKDLQKLVRTTEDDLRERSQEVAEVGQRLKAAYQAARDTERTLDTYETWRDQYLTQVAVGWVLSTVFLRYLEDNALIDTAYLAPLERARDYRQHYFQQHPTHTDREYLEAAFAALAALPGCGELFGPERNPLWLLGPSGDQAKVMVEFWQATDPTTGRLLRVFGDPTAETIADTRFLGDLYQDLSEAARKRYALLQTPDFVEEFILDRTLEPAIDTFGLDVVRMLDPTCGSGHFLLGGFARLLDHRYRAYPGENERVRVQKALDGVYGVDLNPFAAAIARFRLLVAALNAAGVKRLKDAPNFKLHVAAGDSLLHGVRGGDQQLLSTEREWLPDLYATGDYEEATAILSQRYHAVVGNPPYITDKDKAHNAAVRAKYETCHRKFALSVPLTQAFFELCVEEPLAGYVGMITANSFMKREFGKILIERFFRQVDLTHVLDTSGAYIPGHGTPTVILLGRNRSPQSASVKAVLGIRGEPSTPEKPAAGKVWRSIVDFVDLESAENEFVTVQFSPRSQFEKHPWSLSGGGSSELKETIESSAGCLLDDRIESIGFGAILGEDEAFTTRALPNGKDIRTLVEGNVVRDWCMDPVTTIFFPYTDDIQLSPSDSTLRSLWCWRTTLWARNEFSGKTYREAGREWYEYHQIPASKYKTPLSITFAEVATHNHFVLDRGGKVFKQTAPVIKLPEGSTEDQHLALLGLLNSSVGNFWGRQVFMAKGGDQVGTEGARVSKNPWEDRLQRDGSKLQRFPIPKGYRSTIALASAIDSLATRRQELFSDTFERSVPSAQSLSEAQTKDHELYCRMVALQEELDWHNYGLFGIVSDVATLLCPAVQEPIPLRPGERAFEMLLARKVASGDADPTWFERHNITTITQPPADWPQWYRDLVLRRLSLIENDRSLKLLEDPVCKNRWSLEPWDSRAQRALGTRLLNHLESHLSTSDTPTLTTAARLAEEVARDSDFTQVARLYTGRDDYDLTALVTDLVMKEDVPYLSALRYNDKGMRKHAQWLDTWELQRAEDRGEYSKKIPVPPAYASEDFQKSHYWTLRGKLDVPKERFISYPLASRSVDPSPVIGWAGWDHLQQAKALATTYLDRKELDGWDTTQLTPLLAGLQELIPWLLQWHNHIDPETDQRLGDFYSAFLDEETRSLGLTPQHLRDWRPPTKTAKTRKKN